MTTTDAARMITDMKHSGAKQFLVCEHGEAIARALLDADERIAALEVDIRNALGHLRHCCKAGLLDKHDYGLVSWAIETLERHTSGVLTPEGGGK